MIIIQIIIRYNLFIEKKGEKKNMSVFIGLIGFPTIIQVENKEMMKVRLNVCK